MNSIKWRTRRKSHIKQFSEFTHQMVKIEALRALSRLVPADAPACNLTIMPGYCLTLRMCFQLFTMG
jgi:hypothetical protein